MRRSKQQIPHEEAMEILRQQNTGVLSMIDAEGKPYGIPINYALAGDRLLFHCAKQGRRTDALKANPYASFCVIHHGDVMLEKFATDYTSVIVSGKVNFIQGEKEIKEAVYSFLDSYMPRDFPGIDEYVNKDIKDVLMFELIIEEIAGKESKNRMLARAAGK